MHNVNMILRRRDRRACIHVVGPISHRRRCTSSARTHAVRASTRSTRRRTSAAQVPWIIGHARPAPRTAATHACPSHPSSRIAPHAPPMSFFLRSHAASSAHRPCSCAPSVRPPDRLPRPHARRRRVRPSSRSRPPPIPRITPGSPAAVLTCRRPCPPRRSSPPPASPSPPPSPGRAWAPTPGRGVESSPCCSRCRCPRRPGTSYCR